MSKRLKQIVVKESAKRLHDIDNCIIVNYKGVKARQATELRSYLKESGIRMNVVKNTLFRFIGDASGNTALKAEASR